jgi:uncharacterized protein
MRRCGLSKNHKISLGGVELVPDLSGALYVPDYETLVIADLHLEQGTSLARRGIHVPPFDTAITLAQLEAVVAAAVPKRLIFLGDSFHDGDGEAQLDESHTRILQNLTGTYETIWICGNHDPEPPQEIGGQGAAFLMLGPLTLRHEPSLPSPSSRSGEGGSRSETGGELGVKISSAIATPSVTPQEARHLPPFGRRKDSEYEIAGHLHPGCGINQRGRRIYGKCFVSDATRLIMPAFGAYTGGLSITSRAFDGLFSENASAFMIGREAIHKFPFSRVRGQG